MTKVSTSLDLTINLITPISPHDYVPVPPLPPAVPLPGGGRASWSLEIPTTQFWPPGYALFKNKLTTTVFHKGRAIVLDGHDVGYIIPHIHVIPPVPFNIQSILQTLFSSRTVKFKTSKVKMNGTSTGLCILTSWLPTPMQFCGDWFSIPGTDSPTSHLNSVHVGFTLADWLKGVASILLDFAIAAVLRAWKVRKKMKTDEKYASDTFRDAWRRFGTPSGLKPGQTAAQYLGDQIGKKVFSFLPTSDKGPADAWKTWAFKQVEANLTGAIKSAVLGDDFKLSVKVGGSFFNVSPSYTIARGDKPDSFSVGGQAFNWKANTKFNGDGYQSFTLNGNSPVSAAQVQHNAATDTAPGGWTTESTMTGRDPVGGIYSSTVESGPTGTSATSSYGEPIVPLVGTGL